MHHKLLISLDGTSVAIELQAALEAVGEAKPRIVHDHGSEFVNRDVAAVIKTHNLIDIKTRPRHPESNGIVERFNGTVRTESDDDYGKNYLQAEAIINRLMHHYNEERLHAVTAGLKIVRNCRFENHGPGNGTGRHSVGSA